MKKEFEHVEASDTSLAKYLGENSGTREIENSKTEAEATAVEATSADATPRGATPRGATPGGVTPIGATTATTKPEVEKTATQKPAPKFVAEPGVVREITKSQFVALMNAGPYYLIDARLPERSNR